MAALDAKTVNAKSVETVKLNCIQKVSSTNNKRLWQLNKAYYVKLGLEMRDGYED